MMEISHLDDHDALPALSRKVMELVSHARNCLFGLDAPSGAAA